MRFLSLRYLSLLAALAVAPAALAAPAPAPAPAAAPAPTSSDPRLGVGIAVSGSGLTSSGGVAPVSFYVPIDMGKFRIEPWLGLGRRGDQGAGTPSTFAVGFGLGGFYLLQPTRTINAYLGGRLGLNVVNTKVVSPATGVTTSDTGTDIGLVPAAGVEYLPDPHFSVGIEGQFGLVIHTGAGSSTDFGTNALAFLRFYM